MTDWLDGNSRLMTELQQCDPIFQPTSFWEPGVRDLLDDWQTLGIEEFKSWPQAGDWFYPKYGQGLSYAIMDLGYEAMQPHKETLTKAWVRSRLSGSTDAVRDFEVTRAAWDQDRWPFDLDSVGESTVGNPRQRFRLTGHDTIAWGRPYLNYLLLLAALSRHVDRPPQSYIEIGGGFAVLGEIVATRDPDVRYIDADIPPLVSIAAFYLAEVVGGVVPPADLPAGQLDLPRVAAIPNWRIGDVAGPIDVFVNSFSFQEMEPEVVANYANAVRDIGVRWVVSRNSAVGKRRVEPGRAGGAVEPVTSARIVSIFEERGFRTVARHGRPFAVSSGAELVILEAS